MNLLQRLSDRLGDALFAVAVLAAFLMMAHVTVDVLARTLFNHPLAGANELTAAYYMVAVAFLPWSRVTREHGHIAVELFTQRLRARTQARLAAAVDVLTAAYVALFTWQAAVSAWAKTNEHEVWEIPGGFLPVWPTRWLLPAAGMAMVLYVVLRGLQRLSRQDDGHEPRTAP